MLPDRETVIQEGDLLHLVMREENADQVYEVFDDGTGGAELTCASPSPGPERSAARSPAS